MSSRKNEAMETPLVELLEADLVPDSVKATINDIIDGLDRVDKKSKVGELYKYYEKGWLSKDDFNTLRSYSFSLLKEKNQEITAAAST